MFSLGLMIMVGRLLKVGLPVVSVVCSSAPGMMIGYIDDSSLD